MRSTSAGILLYRFKDSALEVFLVHPGGPYWKNKDLHAWSIPKGLCEAGEDPLAAAKREFHEETGFACDGDLQRLTDLRQPGGKRIIAWAVEGDCDAAALESNTFTMEWPPRSGVRREFPEIDQGAWLSVSAAAEKIVKGQLGFLEELTALLGGGPAARPKSNGEGRT